MGGGVSKNNKNNNHICPEDICLDDFERLKKIFKHLDKNKHSPLENSEIEQISEIHIKNKIKKLKKDIKEIEFENKKFILKKNLQFIISKNKLENLKEKSIQDKVLESEKLKRNKEKEIKKLKNMSKNEKKALFKRRISIEGAYNFELFCNYMKTQTHEIHNIRYITPNGKLNELRLQVPSPNSQPKKKLDW
tara:strand:+ start:286 stop:861 length:576 start_codon:yes stop_codon:yes gene_type:complete